MFRFGICASLFLLFHILVSPQLNADESNGYHCDNNLISCIRELEQNIKFTPPQSHLWFHQKLNLLDMWFQTQAYQKILHEIDALLTLDNLPPRIELHCYMYKVKLAYFSGEKYQESYIDRIDRAFSERVSSSPESMIDYATFQLYTQNFKKGRDLLLALESKFSGHSNYAIKKQIYTILGHLTHRLDEPQTTLHYFQLALDNAMLDSGRHYQLVARYNVARATHFLGEIDKAISKFNDTITKANELNDTSYKNLAFLRLAEIYTNTNNLDKAATALNKIQTKHLFTYDVDLFNRLKATQANRNK